MSIQKIGAIALAICSTSVFSKASFEDLRENYQREPRVNTSHVNTAQNPGWAALPETPPQSTWMPNVDLSNSYGTPTLKLDASTGNTAATGGVNSDVKEFVAQEIAKVSGGSGGGDGWEVVYAGSGTRALTIDGSYQKFRGVITYDSSETGHQGAAEAPFEDMHLYDTTFSFSGDFGNTVNLVEKSRYTSQCSTEARAEISFTISNDLEFASSNAATSNCSYYNFWLGKDTYYTRLLQISNARLTFLEVLR